MVPRRPRSPGRPSHPQIGPTLLSLAVAEPPHPRTGDPRFWGESHDATADPRRARQLTSQASRAASRYVVFRSPAFNPSPDRRALGRNLALDLVAAVGVGVSMGLVTALLPTIARRGGLEPLGLSALAAAPFVANLLSAFAGRFGPRSSMQLALVRGVGAASLLLVFVLPIAPVMIAVAFVFRMSLSFGGPFHLRLWGAMYPARLVGRVVGFIGMGRAAAGALAAFAGGVVADRLGGPTAVAIAGAVGVACALAYAGLRPRSAQRAPSFSARGSIRALRERPLLGKVALAQGFYGGGLIGAVPLYALVHVDRLDLRLSEDRKSVCRERV